MKKERLIRYHRVLDANKKPCKMAEFSIYETIPLGYGESHAKGQEIKRELRIGGHPVDRVDKGRYVNTLNREFTSAEPDAP
jgi:hypothetical protein